MAGAWQELNAEVGVPALTVRTRPAARRLTWRRVFMAPTLLFLLVAPPPDPRALGAPWPANEAAGAGPSTRHSWTLE